jgi:hypothetical protein
MKAGTRAAPKPRQDNRNCRRTLCAMLLLDHLDFRARAFVRLRRARYFSFACPKEKYPRENDTPLGACRACMPGKFVSRGRAFRPDSCPGEKEPTSMSTPLRACRPQLTAAWGPGEEPHAILDCAFQKSESIAKASSPRMHGASLLSTFEDESATGVGFGIPLATRWCQSRKPFLENAEPDSSNRFTGKPRAPMAVVLAARRTLTSC